MDAPSERLRLGILAICHGIVASHGGEIEVESEVEGEVGRGTRFSLVLPLDGAPRSARVGGQ